MIAEERVYHDRDGYDTGMSDTEPIDAGVRATADGIGTSGLAVNARERGVPIMTAAQSIELHPETLTGHAVEMKTRAETAVIGEETRAAVGDVAVENPAFGEGAADPRAEP